MSAWAAARPRLDAKPPLSLRAEDLESAASASKYLWGLLASLLTDVRAAAARAFAPGCTLTRARCLLPPQTAWGALLAVAGAAVAAAVFGARALAALAREAVYVVYTFPADSAEFKWMERWLAARPEVAACADARVQLFAPSQRRDDGGGSEDDEDGELLRAAGARGAPAGLGSLVLQAAGGDALRLRSRVLPERPLLLSYLGTRMWITRPKPPAAPSGGGGADAAEWRAEQAGSGRSRPRRAAASAAAPRALQLTLLRPHGERVLAAALREAREAHTAATSSQLTVYESVRASDGRWTWSSTSGVRAVALAEVVFPAEPPLMTALLDDVVRFLDSELWYAQRGIPYHRGYALHGPPGCGKTMAVHALATELHLPLFSINLLASGLSDDALVTLFERVTAPGLILMENVDRVFDANRERLPPPPGGARAAEPSRITFSGLLNVLDGVYSRPGCCSIFTSCAHPVAQSRALMRDGRVDLKLAVPAATPAAGARLFASFFAAHPFHELPPAQLAADAAEFEEALARRAAQQPPYSMRDVASYLATRSPQEALADVAMLGLNAAQVAARALAPAGDRRSGLGALH
jgi:hypothetical protein